MTLSDHSAIENEAAPKQEPGRSPRLRGRAVSVNLVWSLSGAAIYSACRLAVFAVLARVGGLGMTGGYGLALAICTPPFLLGRMNLRTVLATDVSEEHALSSYFGLTSVTSVLTIFAIVGYVVLKGLDAQSAWVIGLVALAQGLDSISEIVAGMLQRRERMVQVGISRTLAGVLSLAFISALVLPTGSLVWGMIGLNVAAAVRLLGYDLRAAARLVHKKAAYSVTGAWHAAASHLSHRRLLSPIWRLAVQAFPLGIVTMLVSLNDNIPRYFIENLPSLGREQLGLFVPAAGLVTVALVVARAVCNVFSPRMAGCYVRGDAVGMRRLVGAIVMVGSILAIVAVAVAWRFGDAIMGFAFGPKFRAAGETFAVMMIVASLWSMTNVLGVSITAMRRFRVQIPIHCFSVSVLTVACWATIPTYGIQGAAWALVASAVLTLVCFATVFFAGLHAITASSSSP